MLRRSIILATVIAFLVGSIGLPVSLYACQMKKAVACGACGCTIDPADTDAAKPCCAKEHTVVRDDVTTAMPQPAGISMQLATAVIVEHFVAADLCAQTPEANFLIHHPPPLEHHAQASYLFNSTFLI
jgi:hypothetical protein